MKGKNRVVKFRYDWTIHYFYYILFILFFISAQRVTSFFLQMPTVLFNLRLLIIRSACYHCKIQYAELRQHSASLFFHVEDINLLPPLIYFTRNIFFNVGQLDIRREFFRSWQPYKGYPQEKILTGVCCICHFCFCTLRFRQSMVSVYIDTFH